MRRGLTLFAILAATQALAVTRVVCAGEHSTQSAYVEDQDEYPALLQNLLGADFAIGNFGYRRATVQTDGPSLYPMSTPYLQTAEFQASLVFAPDVVILGPFGRHDCNLEYADAGSIDRVKFTEGLKTIVAAYRALARQPRILIALPIPYANGDGVGVMHEVVLPATQQVATELGLPTIDHWDVFLGHPELFTNPDHFNDAGIQLMAATVRDALLVQLDAGTDAGTGVDAGTPADGGMLPVIDPRLGPARGCSAAPSGLFAVLALWWIRKPRPVKRAIALALALAGCSVNRPPSEPPPAEAVPEIPRQVRRLSNPELNAVTSDLLGHPANLTAGLLQEPRVEGFDGDAQSLLVTDPKLDDFVATAELVAAQVSTPGCSEAACALKFAADFALKAYGRPLAEDEKTRLVTVYQAGGDHPTGLAMLVEAMLLSPHFIYRLELGAHLSQFETASAISFLFAGARPDLPLLTAAIEGRLGDADERVSQGRRLLATGRGQLRVRDLLLSWLDLHQMEQVNKSLAIYGFFVHPVREAMGTELNHYLDDAAFGADGTLAGLFSSSRAFPSPILSAYYGDDLKGPIGDFTPVELEPTRRRGVLSLAGFLAHHSALDHTAPVQRGLFVRTRLLCDEIAPPPPNALVNLPNPGDTSHTNRDKYAAHSQIAACQGCHRSMDPIGFGMEDFDALGRYQSTDNGFPVDASGALEGTDVDGAFVGTAQLSAKLASSAQVRRCFAQNLWRAAVGRSVTLPSGIQPPADEKITEVLLDVVRSRGFVLRVPGEGETP